MAFEISNGMLRANADDGYMFVEFFVFRFITFGLLVR